MSSDRHLCILPNQTSFPPVTQSVWQLWTWSVCMVMTNQPWGLRGGTEAGVQAPLCSGGGGLRHHLLWVSVFPSVQRAVSSHSWQGGPLSLGGWGSAMPGSYTTWHLPAAGPWLAKRLQECPSGSGQEVRRSGRWADLLRSLYPRLSPVGTQF